MRHWLIGYVAMEQILLTVLPYKLNLLL